MTDEKNKERELFSAALDMSPEERDVFLREACGDDSLLYHRVLDLLEVDTIEDRILPSSAHNSVREGALVEGPGTQLGRFKLLEKIGEGGMGIVYLAEQHEPVLRKVALKIIKIGMDTKQVVARFEAERQALAMMDHPNIAKVLDGGATESGRPYFVMELVQGLPITEFCDQNQLPTEERLRLFARVCQAIQSAHQKGVIHRDIKPSNILVRQKDGEFEPKVIDFGIAKAIHSKLTEETLFTHFGQMIGTPAYMSPEQAEMGEGNVDTRTDVYSLGVLLYELLAGLPPFTSKELLQAGYREMQRIIVEEEPIKPSTRVVSMDGELKTTFARFRRLDATTMIESFRGDLDWITMKCLEKDRNKRYETPNELMSDINRYLNSEPVSAAAPSLLYQLQKFSRKHKALVRAGAAIAAILVVATIVSATLAYWNNRLRIRAEASEKTLSEQALELESNLYVSDMLAVANAVENNELDRAEQLLLAHRIEPSGRDLRDLTWRFYWSRIRGEWLTAIDTLRDRDNALPVELEKDRSILRARILDRSQRLLSLAEFKRLSLWDLASRDLEQEWFVLGAFAVSPNEQFLGFVDSDQRLTIWDLDARRLVRKGRQIGENRFRLAFTHDSRSLVVKVSYFQPTVEKGTVWVEDVATGEVIFRPDGYWLDFAVSPAEPILITTGVVDGTLEGRAMRELSKRSMGYLWDLNRHERIHRPIDARGIYGSGARFSPKGTFVALSHTEDPLDFNSQLGIRIYEVASGTKVSTVERADLGAGISFGGEQTVAFSSDEEYFVAPRKAFSTTIDVWSTRTGERMAQDSEFIGSMRSITFHPETDDIVIACSLDESLVYWNWKENRILKKHTGHRSPIEAMAVAGDGKTVVTGGQDGRLVFWPPYELSPGPLLPPFKQRASWPKFSRQGRYLALGEFVKGIAPPTDGRTAFSAGSKGDPPVQIAVFDTGSHQRVFDIPRSEVFLGFSSDERSVLTLTTNQILSREVVTGLPHSTVNLEAPITSLDFDRPSSMQPILSPDGTILAADNQDGTIRLIDVNSGATIQHLAQKDSYVIAFSPSGKKVLFSRRDRSAGGVWDPALDQIVWLDLGRQSLASIMCASWDDRVVAGKFPNSVGLWDMNTGEKIHSIENAGDVSVLFFTPDNRSVAFIHTFRKPNTLGVFSRLKLFDLETMRQVGGITSGRNTRWVHGPMQSPNGRDYLHQSLHGRGHIELMRIPLIEEIDALFDAAQTPSE